MPKIITDTSHNVTNMLWRRDQALKSEAYGDCLWNSMIVGAGTVGAVGAGAGAAIAGVGAVPAGAAGAAVGALGGGFYGVEECEHKMPEGEIALADMRWRREIKDSPLNDLAVEVPTLRGVIEGPPSNDIEEKGLGELSSPEIREAKAQKDEGPERI